MLSSESHPLRPFLPGNAKVLMLGSFPPQQKRWSMEFFYPNFQNDMWRIMGLLFFADRNVFVDSRAKRFIQEDIVRFLEDVGIALYDTAEEVRRLRDNASDNFLEIIRPTDIDELLRHIPQCEAIVTTGEKATDEIVSQYKVAKPKIGAYTLLRVGQRKLRFYRMPSSSRAYPLALDKKAVYYHGMFRDLGML
jgi:G:T/U-mismatch repair DNA glycosylase